MPHYCKGNKYFENLSQISGHINEKILVSVNEQLPDTFVSNTSRQESCLSWTAWEENGKENCSSSNKGLGLRVCGRKRRAVGGRHFFILQYLFRGESLPRYMQKGKIPYPEQEKQYLYIAKKPLRKH